MDTHGHDGFDSLLQAWWRRRWMAVAVFAVGAAAVGGAVLALPNVYRATATVLVEREQLPDNLVGPDSPGGLEVRLQTINQEVLSRARLSEVIDRFDLYRPLRGRLTPEALVEKLRRDLRMEPRGIAAGGAAGETVAFALGYRGRDPQTAADVANAVAGLYVERNKSTRQQRSQETTALLRAQIREVETRLRQQQQQIGNFSASHAGSLPQQVAPNLAALERLSAQLQLNGERQMRTRDRLDSYAAAAAGARSASAPDAPPEDRLAGLKREYAELRTRYAENYPDVRRLRQRIDVMEREPESPAAPATVASAA
ncbi:MAG TPA: Wzz/FepE/Etk N-terminal domain-containing protein, partial [Candidatus Polarisedimenticolaceae bacterium]|nr:Wzz/FepE/Etk N-terminal domain-containing protein [Candidatus Polarisedimenticolaceae bacterium]